jgi:hypothetical protein
MTTSPPIAGALRAQHGKHIQRGFRCVAIGSDAAMLVGVRGDAFATARNTYI